MKHALRFFWLGFLPTLCLCGLLAGLSAVWINTQSVLTPSAAPLRLEETAPWRYTLEIFTEEITFSIPAPPDKLELFSKYPALLPRSIRLLAWGWNSLPHFQEYLAELLPY